MKKLNILLIMILTITSIFAESGASDVSKDYIRAAFWVFTLVISVGGLLLIINNKNAEESGEE